MRLEDLDFSYPDELIAVEPSRPTRVAFCEAASEPVELDMAGLLEKFQPGDLLVLNESRVIPARIFSENGDEILFLKSLDSQRWEVLFPSRGVQLGEAIPLPGGVSAVLKQKGLPQILELSAAIATDYFEKHGEMALPPYIQQARGERHNRFQDRGWYQAAWAQNPGSVAAPTASLHMNEGHLARLRERGVELGKLTLHVGAGTFMPIRTSKIDEHQMHAERVEIPFELVDQIERTRAAGRRVWALGTTVTRSLESLAQGLLSKGQGAYVGESRLFIKPPYDFEMVDVLMTNFHQPRSTLLCLVAAFAGLDRVKSVYGWAVDRRFRLFSYGDLSVWCK